MDSVNRRKRLSSVRVASNRFDGSGPDPWRDGHLASSEASRALLARVASVTSPLERGHSSPLGDSLLVPFAVGGSAYLAATTRSSNNGQSQRRASTSAMFLHTRRTTTLSKARFDAAQRFCDQRSQENQAKIREWQAVRQQRAESHRERLNRPVLVPRCAAQPLVVEDDVSAAVERRMRELLGSAYIGPLTPVRDGGDDDDDVTAGLSPPCRRTSPTGNVGRTAATAESLKKSRSVKASTATPLPGVSVAQPALAMEEPSRPL